MDAKRREWGRDGAGALESTCEGEGHSLTLAATGGEGAGLAGAVRCRSGRSLSRASA